MKIIKEDGFALLAFWMDFNVFFYIESAEKKLPGKKQGW